METVKQDPPSRRRHSSWPVFLGAALGVLSIALFVWWKVSLAQFYMNSAPPGAGVSRMIYHHAKVYGFGPGGNEVILVMYKMKENAAQRLIADPVAFLEGLPQHGHPTHICSRYSDWRETPMPRIAAIGDRSDGDPSAPITLDEWKNRYGFGFEFHPYKKYHEQLDRTFSHPGAYFSRGRCGVFFLIPEQRLAAFMHVG